jgi:two-component system response regulator AtoC
MSYSILIVDDEALTVRTIGRALESEGFEVFLATSGEEALVTLADEKPDLALLDVVLPGIDGIEVLRQAKKLSPATIIVMMSAYHVVDRAVEAMKLGAYDYLIKPFHIADLVSTIRRATEMLTLRVRVHDTVQSAKGRYDFGRVVTESPVMREVLEMARRAAESDHTTILIQGRAGPARKYWPRPFTTTVRAPRRRSSASTALPFLTLCWRVNCSATNRAPSPTRAAAKKA